MNTQKTSFSGARRILWLDNWLMDLQVSARNLAKYPVAALVAIVSLAGGIGATTATLTLRDVVFRRPPLLYREPAQLSVVQLVSPSRPGFRFGGAVSGALFTLWQDSLSTQTAADIAASTPERVSEGHSGQQKVDALPVRAVTSNFFSILGVRPIIGRTFDNSMNSGGTVEVVLSYGMWQAAFGGRNDVLGHEMWIGDQAYSVAGVLPQQFWFSEMDSPLWTLLDRSHAAAEPALEVVARRRPGVNNAVLSGALESGFAQYLGQLPAGDRDLRLRLSGVEGTPMGRSMSFVLPYLLGVAVFLTLLIACANVAILVIAQWTAREHEIAIRAALGASRLRIIRLLVTESILLAVAGGTLGIAATFAIRGLILRNSGEVTFFDMSLDPWLLLKVGVITLAAGMVSGIGPALLETRRLHGNPIRIIATADRARQRWRHILVVMEISVTVALLVVSSSLLSGYRRAVSTDLGFRTKPLIDVRVDNPGGVPTQRVLVALAQLPGVASASWATSIPHMSAGSIRKIAGDAAGAGALSAEVGIITPEFFTTLDVPLRSGRAFSRDDSVLPHTAIVNQQLASRLFAGRNPLGESVWIESTSYEVVGVVADYLNSAFQPDERAPKAFLPFDSRTAAQPRQMFLVRAADPARLVADVRRAVVSAAPGNTVGNAYTIDQNINLGAQEILIGTAPLAPLLATGLLLTAAGIYGVLAFAIARRTKEFAIRVALGASGADLARLVGRHSLWLIGAGNLIGIGVTFGREPMAALAASSIPAGFRLSCRSSWSVRSALWPHLSLRGTQREWIRRFC